MTQLINSASSPRRVLGLRCRQCQATFDKVYLRYCSKCGGQLVVEYDWGVIRGIAREGYRGQGIWRFWPLLPVEDPRCCVSLGEGNTPLLSCPRLGEAFGLPNLWIKYEGANPSGTFKDRSSATAISAALEFGCWAAALVSTGNGGSSVASYAARAGLKSFVFAPRDSAQPKLKYMSACATSLVLVDGNYDAISRTYEKLINQVDGVFDCGGHASPYKLEGKKTLAYELAEASVRPGTVAVGANADPPWAVPDYVVCPVGTGDQFIATWRGFDDLVRLGWTVRRPRMVCVQSAAADPIVQAWRAGVSYAAQPAGRTVAEGVAIGEHGPKGDWILEMLRQDDGLAVAPQDEEVLRAQGLLARQEGLWAGPTGAISLAGAARLADEGLIPREAVVVCIVSETGLKGQYPLVSLPAMPPDINVWRGIMLSHATDASSDRSVEGG